MYWRLICDNVNLVLVREFINMTGIFWWIIDDKKVLLVFVDFGVFMVIFEIFTNDFTVTDINFKFPRALSSSLNPHKLKTKHRIFNLFYQKPDKWFIPILMSSIFVAQNLNETEPAWSFMHFIDNIFQPKNPECIQWIILINEKYDRKEAKLTQQHSVFVNNHQPSN